MNRQREIIYDERNRVLESESLTEHVFEMIGNVLDDLILRFVNPELREEEQNPDGFRSALHSKFGIAAKEVYFTKHTFDEWREDLLEQVKAAYRVRIEKFGADRLHFLER